MNIVEFLVDYNTWYNSGHPNPGQQGFHMDWNKTITKIVNGGSYFDNPNLGADTLQENNTVSSNNDEDEVMCWPTTDTRITSYFGHRDRPDVAGATSDHGAIDIAATVGAEVYACEDGTIKDVGSNNSMGNYIIIDHGNGYLSKYYHNSEILVSTGEVVTKGQVIAHAGSTGASTGPHVHFQIEYPEGTKIDPLQFKYKTKDGQFMGDGTGGFGSDVDTSSTSNSSGTSTANIVAKVPVWSTTDTTSTTNDPNASEIASSPNYTMSTKPVNFQDLVRGYTMPFDYLWTLLVTGDGKDFVFDLAKLVYNSEIEITVFDNLQTVTTVRENTYTDKTKTEINLNYSVTYGNNDENSHTTTGNKEETKEESNTYTTTETNVTTTNSVDIALTYANVWIVEYSKNYELKHDGPNSSTNTVEIAPKEYGTNPDRTVNSDPGGYVTGMLRSVENQYEQNWDYADATENSVTSKIYTAKVDNSIKTTTTTETIKYEAQPETIREKTDKEPEDDKEENFVTLLLKESNKNARYNILSYARSEILFEMLEDNPNTSEMVDLTRYLLYKATGRDFGVTEYDFSVYNPENFTTATNGIYGGTIQEKVWFALKDLGIDDESVAGAMGNIDYESGGFTTVAVESNGEGIGLCQWSFGRKTQFLNYANSKGVDWKDEDTQVEFLIAEISGQGPAKDYATRRVSGKIVEEGITATFTDWKNATTVNDATLQFMRWFESPKSKSSLGERQTRAQKYYNEFKGKTAPLDIATELTGANKEKMEKLIADAVRIANDDRYQYSQSQRNSEYYYDCSSFVGRLYEKHFNIPRLDAGNAGRGTDNIRAKARSQYYVVSFSSLQPGDVLWKDGHVALYIGNNQIAEAQGTAAGIVVGTFNPGRFTEAYRIIK